MVRILWQARSEILFEAFSKRSVSRFLNGGNAYEYDALQVLSDHFTCSLDPSAVQKDGETIAKYWFRMTRTRSCADVLIKQPYPIAFGKTGSAPVELGIIHHVDNHLASNSLKYRLFLDRLKKRLRHLDVVVTVSIYWRDYLLRAGCKDVRVIYNSFDLSEFEIPDHEVRTFLARYNIRKTKPLIYIGNAAAAKGVYHAYNALQDGDYNLIMTGPENRAPGLPVRYVNLNRREYLILLKACDLMLAMSTMAEGWSRTAHEALLLGTPVIGSGSGGMKELLEGAKQIILSDVSDLADAVPHALKSGDRLVRTGFDFVRRYNHTYFKNAWVDLIHDVCRMSNVN